MDNNPNKMLSSLSMILTTMIFIVIITSPNTPTTFRIIASVIFITVAAVMGIIYYVFKKRI